MGPASLPSSRPAGSCPREALPGLPSPLAWVNARSWSVGQLVGRSVGQSVVPAGWCLLEVTTRPSPKPCRPHAGVTHSQMGPAHSRFTKRTFMNKGNSTILRRCQKVNQILRKSSCRRVAPFPPGGRCNTAGHQAGVIGTLPSALFVAHPLPHTSLKLTQGRLFSSWSYSFQLSQQSEHSPRTPCASQPTGTSTWLGGEYAADEGRGADSQGGSTTRPSSRTGSGHFDLLSEVGLSPVTLPHHAEPSTPCPVNRARAAWVSFIGVRRGQLHRPTL